MTFTYEYLDYTEHENPRTMRGEGIIEFKTGTIVLKMGALPPDMDKIFAQPQTFIRDPYANRVPKVRGMP